ncbi:MAG TPA: hypothetical protein VGF45_06740, partial [Polyangia bacterium]
MAVAQRPAWIDIAADTAWTPRHVTDAELYPEPLAGHFGIDASAWERAELPAPFGLGAYLAASAESVPALDLLAV